MRNYQHVGYGFGLCFFVVCLCYVHASTSRRTRDVVLFEDDFETDQGWTPAASNDNATAVGRWGRADPEGTFENGMWVQPEYDHTPDPGVQCYATGPLAGTAVGWGDVDGGKTTLVSPLIDLSAGDATISYWRWYCNSSGLLPKQDQFKVDISSDDGQSWTNVETLGPEGPDTYGGWIFHEFTVSDFVTPSASIRVRFVAADYGASTLVEAAVDDFAVVCIDCSSLGDADGDGDVDLNDYARFPACMGGPGNPVPPACEVSPTVFDFSDPADGDVDLDDFAAFVQAMGN